MCGISGVYELDADPAANRESVRAMTSAIAHRGPDGEGFYTGKHVALGHRRLSIIDVAGGDQPIFNEDESICIVFNGEIYNYLELYEDLVKRGHRFRTKSDTEVIVHLYEEMGVRCLDLLNGMFTFAIWDKPRERLFIARDRMGEKPLYFFQNGTKLVFGSELKALRTNKDCPRSLDKNALDLYLAYGYIPEPHCIFEGVRKLPAAHYLIAENGQISVQAYWELARPEEKNTASFDDQLAEFSSRIKQSVKLRLRSDVPVGAFLSGGIDSSLMVAVAAEQHSGISTFSVGFSEQDFDELDSARQIADRYGTNHHQIQLDKVDESLFPKIVAHFDEPFSDSSAIPTYYVTQEAAKHVKVCISGDAGDELFGGYSRYMPEPGERQINRIPASLRGALLDPASRMLPDSFRGKGKLRRFAVDGAQRWQRKLGVFDDIERKLMYLPGMANHLDASASLFQPYFQAPQAEALSSRMWADQKTYLPDDILVKVDRTSMWHSLEVRVPFLDHTLVEFANRLPTSSKINAGEQKYILKKFLADKVPNDLLTRPKKGFSLPIRHWLAGDMVDFSHSLLNKNSRICEYLDSSVIESLLHQHQHGSRDLSKRIWSLLWLEQWALHFEI
ncbi:MAG: asparagine synthase (glutamine-hydrolyzing) [Candidatus Azotimanducaceae bacterium]|jgi:asparagine synthase (glutamine-hydrolysing)